MFRSQLQTQKLPKAARFSWGGSGVAFHHSFLWTYCLHRFFVTKSERSGFAHKTNRVKCGCQRLNLNQQNEVSKLRPLLLLGGFCSDFVTSVCQHQERHCLPRWTPVSTGRRNASPPSQIRRKMSGCTESGQATVGRVWRQQRFGSGSNRYRALVIAFEQFRGCGRSHWR